MGAPNISTFRSNFWYYGETGDRLSGVRESEIAKQSAKQIQNMLITETGSLKSAKQYISNEILTEKAEKVIDTSFDFYLIIGSTNIMIINKDSNNLESSVQHNVANVKSVNIIDKRILFINNKTFQINETNRTVTASNYLDKLIFPISNVRDVKIDLWKKVHTGTGDAEVKKMSKMGEFTNYKLKVGVDGKIYTPQTQREIKRVYVDYLEDLEYDDVEINDGEYLAILHSLEEVNGDKGYNIGNKRVELGAFTDDTKLKGKYFTTFTVTEATIGEFIFGTLNNIKDFEFSSLFQDKLVIFYNDKIYFSRDSEYLDFRNSQVPKENTEPFYVKPSPIEGNQPNVLKVIADEGLYVITNRGVYLGGHRSIITPFNRGNFTIMSNTETNGQAELIADSLFIMTNENVLKCIQPIYTNVNISYQTYNVDKFNTGNNIIGITKHTVEGNDYIVASVEGRDKVYLFQLLNQPNTFRRNTQILNTPDKLIGFRGKLIMGKEILIRDSKNAKNTLLFMNTPYLKTKTGGSYLNDVNSTVQRVVVKVLNQDRDAIAKVKINGYTMNTLGSNIEDIYSLYDFKTQFPIKTGFKIEIETKENNKIMEIQGIDVFINVKGS